MITPDWLIGTAHAAASNNLNDLPTVNVLNGSPTPDSIANNFASFLLWLAWPLGSIAIFYTAYLLVTSGGKPDAMEKGKKNLIYLVSGLALIIFAVVILRVVLGFLFSGTTN